MSAERPIMDGKEKPFAYMLGEAFQANIEEYINIHDTDSDAIDAHNERVRLDRLKLSESSTASDVRKRAEEIKVSFHHFLAGKEHGNYESIAHDLYYALGRTHDVHDLEDVLMFLFTNSNLEQVRHEHYLFHNTKITEVK